MAPAHYFRRLGRSEELLKKEMSRSAVIPGEAIPMYRRRIDHSDLCCFLLGNMDEETIYVLTKGLFENNDYLVAQNAALADTIPKNAMVGVRSFASWCREDI